MTVVLNLRRGDQSTTPRELPNSNVWFYCDDLAQTYDDLVARGVEFPKPPIEQPFGWWSMFEDTEGNGFALTLREA